MFNNNEKDSCNVQPQRIQISHRSISWLIVIFTSLCFISFIIGYAIGKKSAHIQQVGLLKTIN